jgi:hypothetical protein
MIDHILVSAPCSAGYASTQLHDVVLARAGAVVSL